MSSLFNVRVSDNQKEFDKVFAEYMTWQKKQPSEIINGKLYFVALQAMGQTKTATKDGIRNKLMQPARITKNVPLAAILVNSKLGKAGKKGLTGVKMAKAVDKLVRAQQSRTQFLRSGWIPALKTLDYWNKRNSDNLKFVKRFAPKKPMGVKEYGKPKGYCIYAKPDRVKTWGEIGNTVGSGKQDTKTVHPLLKQGLDKGIALETASMRTYITRKFNEEFERINKRQT